MQKIKYKPEQYFSQNYLQSKHKHPKSFTKHMTNPSYENKKLNEDYETHVIIIINQ